MHRTVARAAAAGATIPFLISQARERRQRGGHRESLPHTAVAQTRRSRPDHVLDRHRHMWRPASFGIGELLGVVLRGDAELLAGPFGGEGP